MALEVKDKEIGRGRYFVTQLGSGKGRQVLTRLIKVLGPVVAHVVQDAKPGAALSKLSGSAMRDALLELSSRISEADLTYFCETFGEFSSFQGEDGKRPKLTLQFQEIHFAGRYAEMMQWLAFAAEANFADFFDVLAPSAGSEPQPTE